MKRVSRARQTYADKNREAARIVLADSERYAGSMQEWARMVLAGEAEWTGPPASKPLQAEFELEGGDE